MPPYEPKPLSQPPPGRFTEMVEAAKQGRLVLYLGAGISMAEPSCGPSGWEVADFLRPTVARLLSLSDTELVGLSLEELAERVVETDATRLEALRVRASEAANFKDLSPNFGHEAAVLLLREGMVRLITVNWDCGVERAGLGAGIGIQGVANAVENSEFSDGLVVLKVHGCATRPRTLAITQSEVDSPQSWAVGRVQGALSEGIVVFVGLGTVGLYVREPIEELVNIWGASADSVLVADPALSPGWQQALGAAAQQAHIQCEADEFLDDLLRAVMLEALDMCSDQIQKMPRQEPWEQTLQTGFENLRTALAASTADALGRWWRDRVSDSLNGSQFIIEQNGLWSLMTVGLLAGKDGGAIEVSGARGRQTVGTKERYFEIASEPGRPIAAVEQTGRERIRQRIADGIYPSEKSISVVVSGATGKFPSSTTPREISAGSNRPADIAEGAESISMTFISAEEGMQGGLFQ
jgi:hypothetical protein